MLRSYILPGVLAGIFCAFLFISSMSVVGSITSMFIPFPLMLTGLSTAGFAGFWISSLTAGLAIAGSMGPNASFAFALMFAAPTLAMLALLKRRKQPSDNQSLGDTSGWYSTSTIIVICTIAALVFIAMLFVSAMGADGGVRSLFKESILLLLEGEEGIEQILADNNSPVSAEEFISLASAIAPAIISVGMLLMLIANAWLAQWLLSRLGRSVRPPLRIASVQLPEIFSIALLLLIGASVMGGDIALLSWSMVAVVLTPFFFVGLGLAHLVSEQSRQHPFFLVVFYIALAVFPGFPILVAIMGLTDQWFDLRRKIKPGPVGPSD